MGKISFDYSEFRIEQIIGITGNEELAGEVLAAGVPIVTRAIVKRAEFHRASGDMIESIKATEIKKNKNGTYCVVRPTGKGRTGIRNMEKMMYLEFGASHHGQPATPVLTPALRECEKETLDAMQRKFDSLVGG